MKAKLNVLKSSLLLILLLILVSGIKVEAADDTVVNKQVCLANRELYNVSWDTVKNSGVKESIIDETAITNGYVTYPEGISEEEKEKYKINSVLISANCWVENGVINVCPTNEETDNIKVNNLLELDNSGNYKNIIVDFDISSGTYTIKIKDLSGGKIKVRVSSNSQLPTTVTKNDGSVKLDYNDARYESILYQNANDGTKLATDYSNFLTKSDGYFIVNNVKPSSVTENSNNTYTVSNSILTFEIYISDASSKCNNSYVTSFNYIVPMVDDIEIDNPALTDSSYGCDEIKNYVNALKNNGIISGSVVDTVYSNYVSMCYTKKISYSDYLELKAKIQEQFEDLKTLSGYSSIEAISPINTSNNGVTCNNTVNSGGKIVIAKSGSYFSLTCKETYSATGDKAKLVYAGAGFTYVSTFTATRTCTLVQTGMVRLKPKCVYSCSTVCTYSTSSGTVTDNKAGPSEEFDYCINTCDGGKYTQSCINSCYESVYGSSNEDADDDTKNSRNLPQLDQNEKTKSLLEDYYGIEKIDKVYPVGSSAGGILFQITSTGNKRYMVDVETEHCGTVGVIFSSYCDTHDGSCLVTETKGPGGCVDNPYEVYNSQLSAAESEFGSMLDEMNKTISTGNYTVQIADSYLQKNNTAYTYEISSKSNSNIISTNNSSSCTNRSFQIGDQGDYVSGCSNTTTTKTVTVKLAKAYLDKKTGNALYETASNRFASFKTSTASTKLESVSFNSKSVYSGGRRYYTSILSDNVNVNTSGKKVTLVDSSTAFSNKQATIKVSVDSFGTTSDYSKNVNCYYGVYNNTICKDGKCGTCTGCSDGEEETTGNGITLIFRPIDLTDNFPNNRSPRWNWTSSASRTLDTTLNYKIDPIELTESIETKGYTIYEDDSEEVDYNFVLTPENIQAIRKYNKTVDDLNSDGSKNYLDYDLTCITRKDREYCISNFMSNSTYVGYADGYNSTIREEIAKCNNATKSGTTCDD